MTALQLFHPRQSDTIVSHIQNLVALGVLRPGDKIPPERDLAKELGLGRGTIREAFQQLETLGVIERSLRSRFVRDQSSNAAAAPARNLEDERRFLLQVIEVRVGLEGWIAAEVARTATKEDLRGLRRIHEAMEVAIAKGEDIAQLDIQFHRAMVEATRNPVALQVLEMLTTMISSIAAFKQLTLDPHRPIRTDAHQAVIDAVERRDAAGAQAAMTAHLEATRSAISGAPTH